MKLVVIPSPDKLEPLPLVPEIETAEPYPVNALGECLGAAARAIADTVKVSDALAAQSVLSAAAMAAQPHANVLRDGQLIPLSLFALTIAESGDRKSTADRLALRSHHQYQRELIEAFKAEEREFIDRQDAYQRARSVILDRSKGNPESVAMELSKLQKPHVPPSPFVLAEEPTLEGLHKSLLYGHPSQGIFSDEGGQFFGGYVSKPENLLRSVAGLCRLWDGSPILRTRAAQGESAARHGCRLSAHLMIQPIVATSVLSNSVMQGQGFLARFLIAWPQSLAGTRFYENADPNSDQRLKRYWQRMDHLLNLKPTIDESGELTPKILPLEPQALPIWIAEHDDIEAQLGRGGDMLDIKPTAAKHAENVLRIAGILAVVDNSEVITLTTINRAVELMRWYLNEALRLTYPAKVSPHLLKAQRLLDWLVAKKWDGFDARRLQREGPRFVRTSARERNVILEVLAQHRWLICSEDKYFLHTAVATMATTATSQMQRGLAPGDTVATRGDKLET
jgi:hypothetical protein